MTPLSIASSPLLLPFPKTLTLAPPPPLPHSSPSKPYSLPLPLRCSSSSPPSPIQVADLVEKDYSFLESDSAAPHHSRAIAAAEIGESSRVLISFPTVEFVDRVAESGPCEVIVAVHEALSVLGKVKERNDAVRCFYGGIEVVSNKFLPLDVVFICYFPGLGVSIDELLRSVAKRCSSGARLVISFDQGRGVVEREHSQKHLDTILPDKKALENSATTHSFQLTEFVDEPAFYLAVLKFHA